MYKTKYFQETSFLNTLVARKTNIDNTPTKEVSENIMKLMDELDKVAKEWAKPICIVSGYRCPKLDKALGYDGKSTNCDGSGADIMPFNKRSDDLLKLIKQMAKDGKVNLEAKKVANGINVYLPKKEKKTPKKK